MLKILTDIFDFAAFIGVALILLAGASVAFQFGEKNPLWFMLGAVCLTRVLYLILKTNEK